MPPKKEAKKDPKGAKGEPEDGADDAKEMTEKELVISYLNSKLGRYQEQGEKLQVENFKLFEELEIQRVNLRDISEFLTNELKARSLTTTALEEKVLELQQHVEDQRKHYESEFAKLQAERNLETEAAEERLREFERKMRGAQEFIDRREQLEQEMSALQASLESVRKEREAKISELDRQHIQEKERWRRETTARIKEAKLAMMRLTDAQLENTTKRTITENDHMAAELAYQSRQMEKLLSRNAELGAEVAELHRVADISRATHDTLAARNSMYQKTIKALLEKLKDSIAMEGGDELGVLLEQQEHIAQLEHDTATQRERIAQLEGQLDAKAAELQRLSGACGEVAQLVEASLEEMQQEAAAQQREGGSLQQQWQLPQRTESLQHRQAAPQQRDTHRLEQEGDEQQEPGDGGTSEGAHCSDRDGDGGGARAASQRPTSVSPSDSTREETSRLDAVESISDAGGSAAREVTAARPHPGPRTDSATRQRVLDILAAKLQAAGLLQPWPAAAAAAPRAASPCVSDAPESPIACASPLASPAAAAATATGHVAIAIPVALSTTASPRSPLGITLPPIVSSPQQAQKSCLAQSAKTVSISNPYERLWPGQVTASDEAKPSATTDTPSVEDLIARLTSDVRPWGNKAKEVPITAQSRSYLRKGQRGQLSPSRKSSGW